MVGVWTYGIRTKGAKAYFSHFVQPYKFLLPLNIIEEITKPISLALRLFGNIFAGGILLALIGVADRLDARPRSRSAACCRSSSASSGSSSTWPSAPSRPSSSPC